MTRRIKIDQKTRIDKTISIRIRSRKNITLNRTKIIGISLVWKI